VPQTPNPFPHLTFEVVRRGQARLHGGGEKSARTVANEANRPGHAVDLRRGIDGVRRYWEGVEDERSARGLPALPAGRPLLLVVDETDIEVLRSAFGFEIVAEEENGYVLAATGDHDFAKLEAKLEKFIAKQDGGGSCAKLHQIVESTEERFKRVLDDALLARWPNIRDDDRLIVDISVACSGDVVLGKFDPHAANETADRYEKRLARHQERHGKALLAIDTIQAEREDKLLADIRAIGGEVVGITQDGPTGAFELPDSFTVRARVTGLYLKDLAQNHPHLFKLDLPDDVEQPFAAAAAAGDGAPLEVAGPAEDAPAVCVIDSGMQEEHRLLAPAVLAGDSKCFIPGHDPDDTADYVAPHGHGTRVAGAILYPCDIPRTGRVELPCWLHNARVLQADNNLPETLMPALYMEQIVGHFNDNARERRARIFNHSINSTRPARTVHMSTWGAAIDKLSYTHDVLVVQSAGNIVDGEVLRHLQAGRKYPDYLSEHSCRIRNPAQSLNALTVGSVAHAEWTNGHRRSMAEMDKPSAFSASGEGLWGSVKPDVVEYGGDYAFEEGPPIIVTCCGGVAPELIRSTLHSPGALSRDGAGTSFSAPKVAHIAAILESELPEEPCLLYRALIANSARWPAWAEAETEKCEVLRRIGYGIPSVERATTNDAYRVTLVSSGVLTVAARTAHLYHVPVPESLRRPEEDRRIRIDITLSYAALPRRTRRGHRGYLSTVLDWDVSKSGESMDAFRRYIFHDGADARRVPGNVFKWMLRDNTEHGEIQGMSRQASTLQKDWCYVNSNELPADFCIAVVGHTGWDPSPERPAKYALAVSFEAVNRDIPVYGDVRAMVEAVQTGVNVRERIQIPVEEQRFM